MAGWRTLLSGRRAYWRKRNSGLDAVYLLDALLPELSRQRTSMHPQSPGRLGDVEAGVRKGLVNAFPFERLDRGGPLREPHVLASLGAAEGRLDVVGGGRFGPGGAGARA